MPFGWIVLALLTAAAAVAAVGVALRTAPSGRAELGVASALFFFALIVTPVMVLGYTQQLYPPRLAVAALALSTSAFALSARGRGLVPHLRATTRAILSLVRLPLDGVLESVRARSVIVAGLAVCGWMIGATVWLSYLAPGEGWDALFYHEAIVGYAIQDHGFVTVPLPPNPMVQSVNGFPRGAESIALWFVIFSDRTFIEIGNTLAAPWLMLSVYALARRYGDRVASMGWASVTLMIPAMWTQMRNAYLDVEITFFLFAALYYATRPTFRVRDALCATLAMVLVVSGKGTGLVLAPPLALVAYGRLVLHYRKTRLRTVLVVAGFGTVAMAGVAALCVLRNWLAFRNPVWPVTLDMFGLHFEGLIPYKALNPEPPLQELLKVKYAPPSGDGGDLIQRDYGIAVPWVIVPIGLVALVPLALAAFRDAVLLRRFGPTTNLALVVILGLVAAKTSNSWMSARFNIQPLCALMLVIAWIGRRGRWARFGEGAVAAAVVLSVVPILWMKDWYWWLTAQKIHELSRAPRLDRAYMYSDPGNMPASVGRLRETQLGPGDRVAYTQDETWIATLWNFHFSNYVQYVQYDDPASFLQRIGEYGPKWIVVGASGGARTAIEQRPSDWEYVGVATPNDSTVVFQRRGSAR